MDGWSYRFVQPGSALQRREGTILRKDEHEGRVAPVGETVGEGEIDLLTFLVAGDDDQLSLLVFEVGEPLRLALRAQPFGRTDLLGQLPGGLLIEFLSQFLRCCYCCQTSHQVPSA